MKADGLTIGKRDSVGASAFAAVLTALILPGLGVVFIPVMVADRQIVWGFVGWVALWAWFPFGMRRLQRTHRIDGSSLVSTYHRRTITRSLSDVVLLSAAPFYVPAARVQFDDGSAFWAWGPNTKRVLAAVLEQAEQADNQLPEGDWLRPRRIVWFVLGLLAAGWE